MPCIAFACSSVILRFSTVSISRPNFASSRSIALAAIAYFGGIIAVSIGIIAAGVRLGTRKRRD
jgi:hypothetical protein